ncbi:MAG: adenylate/guanylate cyclase domain-containing protein [Acidimicrobiia bacterium]
MQTFLFTDIESSTRLWEEHPDEMAPALARHDAILNEAVERAGGKVVKTTGDGFLAVFDSVSDTLAATVDAQSALAAEPWGPIGPIRVRMGVHAGNTENRDGDYFGPTMNRAARIMAAGHGGQVLLSAVAAGLADGRLPSGAQLRDLGIHRLKDLTLPEHLFQLVHDGLESEFPPPLTLDARPHNFPLQTTEFLGRENELASIQVMLESPSTRLLTITGPGGAGNTRLGLQVAAEQMDLSVTAYSSFHPVPPRTEHRGGSPGRLRNGHVAMRRPGACGGEGDKVPRPGAVYASFTEGFDEHQLVQAKRLLD